MQLFAQQHGRSLIYSDYLSSGNLLELPVSETSTLLSNLAGISREAGNPLNQRQRRSLTDSHASCSSFISLGNSAKKRIVAFMLNSRLAKSKNGFKKTPTLKKRKKKKRNKKKTQTPPNFPADPFPKKIEILEHFTKNTLNISLWKHGKGAAGSQGPGARPPRPAEGHVPPGWHLQALVFSCTHSLLTLPSVKIHENKPLHGKQIFNLHKSVLLFFSFPNANQF